MPISITITPDFATGTAEMHVTDGESGCVDIYYDCMDYNGTAKENVFYRRNDYALPVGMCLGKSLCVYGELGFTASGDGFASDDATTFDASQEWMSYLRDDANAQYISCPFDLSSVVGGDTFANIRFVLTKESGSIGDDAFTVYRQDTAPTLVADVETANVASAAGTKTVKADDRVMWDVTTSVQAAIDAVAAGDPVGTVVLVIKVESTSTSLDEVKFYSSRNTAGKKGPTLYLRKA